MKIMTEGLWRLVVSYVDHVGLTLIIKVPSLGRVARNKSGLIFHNLLVSLRRCFCYWFSQHKVRRQAQDVSPVGRVVAGHELVRPPVVVLQVVVASDVDVQRQLEGQRQESLQIRTTVNYFSSPCQLNFLTTR